MVHWSMVSILHSPNHWNIDFFIMAWMLDSWSCLTLGAGTVKVVNSSSYSCLSCWLLLSPRPHILYPKKCTHFFMYISGRRDSLSMSSQSMQELYYSAEARAPSRSLMRSRISLFLHSTMLSFSTVEVSSADRTGDFSTQAYPWRRYKNISTRCVLHYKSCDQYDFLIHLKSTIKRVIFLSVVQRFKSLSTNANPKYSGSSESWQPPKCMSNVYIYNILLIVSYRNEPIHLF